MTGFTVFINKLCNYAHLICNIISTCQIIEQHIQLTYICKPALIQCITYGIQSHAPNKVNQSTTGHQSECCQCMHNQYGSNSIIMCH